jgi:hypothetical protein
MIMPANCFITGKNIPRIKNSFLIWSAVKQVKLLDVKSSISIAALCPLNLKELKYCVVIHKKGWTIRRPKDDQPGSRICINQGVEKRS